MNLKNSITIALSNDRWCYDPNAQLGEAGGFGCVYEGVSLTGEPVAIKRLNLDVNNVAAREMDVAKDLASRTLQFVIPVFDSGLNAESDEYFVVMPRADKNLADHIKAQGTVQHYEAAMTVRQIACGLLEVQHLVHRDLKPENILFHNAVWKIADFGIAKFVQEATAAKTLKNCRSPAYAAPEQWRNESTTNQTDIYALGCIGFALLTGKPPFGEGTGDSVRDGHLNREMPTLGEDVPPLLRSLLVLMTRKNADLRPSLKRVLETLDNILNAPSVSRKVFGLLQQAGAFVAEEEATEDRIRTQAAESHARRLQLARDGRDILDNLVKNLLAEFKKYAPNAECGDRAAALGKASLSVNLPSTQSAMWEDMLPPEAFQASQWDMVAGQTITLNQRAPDCTLGASLWLGRGPAATEYRWYEVAFWAPRSGEPTMHALLKNIAGADLALAAAAGSTFEIAFGPVPIDGEHQNDFLDRWGTLFSLAAVGELQQLEPPLKERFWETIRGRRILACG